MLLDDDFEAGFREFKDDSDFEEEEEDDDVAQDLLAGAKGFAFSATAAAKTKRSNSKSFSKGNCF